MLQLDSRLALNSSIGACTWQACCIVPKTWQRLERVVSRLSSWETGTWQCQRQVRAGFFYQVQHDDDCELLEACECIWDGFLRKLHVRSNIVPFTDGVIDEVIERWRAVCLVREVQRFLSASCFDERPFASCSDQTRQDPTPLEPGSFAP